MPPCAPVSKYVRSEGTIPEQWARVNQLGFDQLGFLSYLLPLWSHILAEGKSAEI